MATSTFDHRQWFAIYTRHQHEKAIATSLAMAGVEAFLPLYESVRQWKDRKKALQLPLFPSYVFVRHSPEQHLRIVSTPGVHFFVTVAGRPAAIPEDEIVAIQKATKDGECVLPHPFLRAGDTVRVKSGPLVGLEGVLVRAKSGHRLVLSAVLLEKSISIEVDITSVERIHRPLSETLVTGAVKALKQYASFM